MASGSKKTVVIMIRRVPETEAVPVVKETEKQMNELSEGGGGRGRVKAGVSKGMSGCGQSCRSMAACRGWGWGGGG